MRLRAEDLVNSNELDQDVMYKARKLEFALFQLRQRFPRKEINRQECIEAIKQLMEEWRISAGLPESEEE